MQTINTIKNKYTSKSIKIIIEFSDNKNTVPAVVSRHKVNSFSYQEYTIKERDDSF